MNASMRAQQSTTDGDFRNVRCDSGGRLLLGSGGVGLPAFYSLSTTAPAYAAGDNVGGEQELPLVLDAFTAFQLQSLTFIDPAAQSANLLVMFFAAAKTTTGATMTDNAAFAWGAGSAAAAYCGGLEIVAADWKTVNAKQVASLTNLGLMVRADAAGSVWMCVVALDGPTFGTGGLFYKPGFVRL